MLRPDIAAFYLVMVLSLYEKCTFEFAPAEIPIDATLLVAYAPSIYTL